MDRVSRAHSSGLAALGACLQPRRTSSTPVVGKHANQGPEGLRHSLHQEPRCALHREHHA